MVASDRNDGTCPKPSCGFGMIVDDLVALWIGIRRADRRVRKSVYRRDFFLEIGTRTKFDLENNPR